MLRLAATKTRTARTFSLLAISLEFHLLFHKTIIKLEKYNGNTHTHTHTHACTHAHTHTHKMEVCYLGLYVIT